jgi:ferredoxin-NADP reductase
MNQQVYMDLRVRSRANTSSRSVLFELESVTGQVLPQWLPGSHIELALETDGGPLVRQYSLCGDRADTSQWTIAVLREKNSRGGSSFMCDHLNVGDTVRAKGPRNNFIFEPQAQRVTLMAAGIGITPIISMAFEAERKNLDWRLIYMVCERSDVCLATSLSRLPAEKIKLHYSAEAGRFDLQAWADTLGADDTVYACGPLRLLDDLSALHDEQPIWSIHLERFENPNKFTGDDVGFELVLARSAKRLHVASSESILTVLRREGIDIPWSCCDGVCGTCEQTVLDGIPDHRDAVLSQAERSSNKHVMVCVSRSMTPSLTLDL